MRIIVAIAALAGLGACTTTNTTPMPVSIGGGANSLKRAPCAGCTFKGQKPGIPAFLQDKSAGLPA
jgi:hypothetical protein